MTKIIRSDGWASGNLAACPLTAYGFRVEATVGSRSMSYRFARAFHTDVCLTVVNIDAPSTLAGTEVAITEHRVAQQLVTPIITTFIPTMQEPKTITGRNVYECLPLTDIGYLDLMAYPSATGVKAATPPSGWQPLTTATQVRTIAGPGSIFIVEELVDSVVTARSVLMDGSVRRTWRALGLDQQFPRVPRDLEVSLKGGKLTTIFHRASEVVTLPISGTPTRAKLSETSNIALTV